jgi:hypothetical protein
MIYAVFGPPKARGEIFSDNKYVSECLNSLKDVTLLISGGGRGIETFAEEWAEAKKIPFKLIPPNLIGSDNNPAAMSQAFDTRNIEMITKAEMVAIFWDAAFPQMVTIAQRAIIMKKRVLMFPI